MLVKSFLLSVLLASTSLASPAKCRPSSSESAPVAAGGYVKPGHGGSTKYRNACPTKNGKYVGPNAKKCFPVILDADAETDDLLAAIYTLKTPYADVRWVLGFGNLGRCRVFLGRNRKMIVCGTNR